MGFAEYLDASLHLGRRGFRLRQLFLHLGADGFYLREQRGNLGGGKGYLFINDAHYWLEFDLQSKNNNKHNINNNKQ